MQKTDYGINLIIFLITLIIVLSLFREDGKWTTAKSRIVFRYFTIQSNVFCAFSSLLLCIFPASRIVWILKYIGTAAVSVTLLTVLVFLGPKMGYKLLLTGIDFFMHLLTPLLAIISFSFLERRGMSFCISLTGMLPVILYGFLYLYKILLAPEGKKWDDFYGFNQGGKWPAAFLLMTAGTFCVCTVLRFLQNTGI